MHPVRSEHSLRRLGLIVAAGGFALSGLGVATSVALLPIGILIALAGTVIALAEAAAHIA